MIAIAWIFTAIIVVALLVPIGNRLLWGKLGPLHIAAWTGDVAKCERLVNSGVPVDTTDGEGDTPLDWAIFDCKTDVVRKLIELGANVNHADQRGFTPLMYTATNLRECPRSISMRAAMDPRRDGVPIQIAKGAVIATEMAISFLWLRTNAQACVVKKPVAITSFSVDNRQHGLEARATTISFERSESSTVI